MRLRRSALAYWLAAVIVALGSGLVVSRLVGEAAARAARLGGLVEVPVTTRSVGAGAVVRAGDVEVVSLPAHAVPRGPVARSPAGRVAVVPMVPGEVVLASKLAPNGLRGVAALVPRGRRALAVPADAGGLALRVGNRVDVLATFDVAGDGPAPEEPTFPVAQGAWVVDADEDGVTVAVLPDEAPRVAFALARGTVTLALAGS